MRLQALLVVSLVSSTLAVSAQQPQKLMLDDKQFTAEIFRAAGRWAESRPCLVTAEAKQAIAVAFKPLLTGTLVQKAQKYDMDEKTARLIIENSTESYLDLLKSSPELRGQACAIDTGTVVAFAIPKPNLAPETGYLLIDGLERGADIFINGERKGQIQARFVLSVGRHTWKTMKCEEAIDVRLNESISRYCRIR